MNSEIQNLTRRIEVESDRSKLSRLHLLRGSRLGALGNRTDSVKDYLSALELADCARDASTIKGMIALSLCEAGEKEQAAWWALGAIETDMSSVDGHLALGLICSSFDYQRCAIRAFREVLTLDPNHAQARLELGKALRESVDLAGAASELERYVADHPDDASGFFELGWTAHVNLGLPDRVERAIAYYNAALAVSRDAALQSRIQRKLNALQDGAAKRDGSN